MPVLRKACQACTKSKRRCVPELPSCERCVAKHIPCVYDLEPVVKTEQPPSTTTCSNSNGTLEPSSTPLSFVYDSVENARQSAMAAIANGQGLNSPGARPMLSTDGDISRWLIAFFTQVAKDGLEHKASPFVHPRVFRSELSPVAVTNVLSAGNLDKRAEIQIILKEIHDLITHSLQRLLLEKPSNKKDAEVEQLIVRMFSTTSSLWSAAPTNLDELFSTWESWIVAESVRRSMFAAIMIRGLWHVAAHGYCYYEPFYESMPFDPRAGIWEAESLEEWQQALGRHGGEHTKLKSYHEFITMQVGKGSGKLDRAEDGSFQRMLYVCYHGSNGIRCVEELDKQAPGRNGV